MKPINIPFFSRVRLATIDWTVWENIRRVLEEPPRGLLSIGLLVTIWAASGGVNMTMTALDRCYEVERGRSFFRRRFVAIGITVVVAIMIIAVLMVIPTATSRR